MFGGPVDFFGLYLLALLMNVCGLLWACGLAMRLRSMQAGPLMQMPVFLVLFFAPVYVPLALLTGWIETLATLNPLTYVLEAARSLLAGDEVTSRRRSGWRSRSSWRSPSGRCAGCAARRPPAEPHRPLVPSPC